MSLCDRPPPAQRRSHRSPSGTQVLRKKARQEPDPWCSPTTASSLELSERVFYRCHTSSILATWCRGSSRHEREIKSWETFVTIVAPPVGLSVLCRFRSTDQSARSAGNRSPRP